MLSVAKQKGQYLKLKYNCVNIQSTINALTLDHANYIRIRNSRSMNQILGIHLNELFELFI